MKMRYNWKLGKIETGRRHTDDGDGARPVSWKTKTAVHETIINAVNSGSGRAILNRILPRDMLSRVTMFDPTGIP
jgi:hypothetical protein